VEEVAQVGCGRRLKWSVWYEQNHSSGMIASGGGEWYGDVLRQGGGAAGLCIGDHLSVLLRDVASLVLRDAGTPAAHSTANICLDFANVPITHCGIISLLRSHANKNE